MKPTYKEYIQRQLQRDRNELDYLKIHLNIYQAENMAKREVLEERIRSQEKQLEA